MTRVLIANGQVLDGSGGAAVTADVLVEGDRIGDIRPGIDRDDADLVLDASDRIVAPGFVDLHTHFDAQVFFDPMLSSSCFHGVATAVGGNCGFSLAPYSAEHRPIVLRMLRDLEDMPTETLTVAVPPAADSFAEYLRAFEERGPMLNFGSFIGHSTVRIAAMGEEAYGREATADEVEQMKALVAEALAAGALGFATKTLPGARPSPSQYASREETLALLKVLKAHGSGVAMFNPGGNFDLDQVYEHQAEIGVPFTWIAMLAMYDGSHNDRVALHRKWRERGADVRPQVSCRPLVAQCTLRMPSVFRSPALTVLNNGTDEARLATYADQAWRDATRPTLTSANTHPIEWQDVEVVDSRSRPEAVGQTVASLAREHGADPFDLLLDMAIADRLETRVEVSYGNTDKDEITKLLNVEGTVFGLSDAGAHPEQTCDAVLPTDMLGNWVRDRGVMPLATAVRKLTGEPAEMLGLKQRGRIAKGYYADITVFDPATVGPGEIRLVHDMPGDKSRLLADHPTGMHHGLINGVVTRQDEQSRYMASGRILRS
jgi:N-acyl-D-aspartate/D-glutamate deacylase